MRPMAQIRAWDEVSNAEARDFLGRALALDPAYPRAHSLLALAYISGAHMGWLVPDDVGTPARDAARRAIAGDSNDPWGHLALGYVHLLSRQAALAVDELGEALWLNPNFALGHLLLGLGHGYGGNGDEGLKEMAVSTQLSPRDPNQAP